MAADAGKTIMLFGVAGAGAYVIYEYTQYSHALSLMDSNSQAQAQQILPFMSYLMAKFSAPAAGTPAAGAFNTIQGLLSGTLVPSTQAPGSGAGSGQPSQTSVGGSSGTSTSATAALPQPTSADLQKVLNATTGTADQWNYAYHQLTGYGIEQIYGASFDAIYGAIDSSGARSSGIITGDAFLSRPSSQGLTRVTTLHGLGAIARFYTPVVNPMSSMVYRANHPSPYRFPVTGGMGAFTQATGFEKALWAGRFLRGNKIL